MSEKLHWIISSYPGQTLGSKGSQNHEHGISIPQLLQALDNSEKKTKRGEKVLNVKMFWRSSFGVLEILWRPTPIHCTVYICLRTNMSKSTVK